jgi:hypothetical protein
MFRVKPLDPLPTNLNRDRSIMELIGVDEQTKWSGCKGCVKSNHHLRDGRVSNAVLNIGVHCLLAELSSLELKPLGSESLKQAVNLTVADQQVKLPDVGEVLRESTIPLLHERAKDNRLYIYLGRNPQHPDQGTGYLVSMALREHMSVQDLVLSCLGRLEHIAAQQFHCHPRRQITPLPILG